MALTTVANVKTQLRITGSDQDTILTDLVSAVDARLKRLIGRNIEATDYTEWHDGYLEDELALRQFPVIRVNAVLSGEDTALSVTYSGSAIIATVQVTESSVRLYSVSTSGSVTATDLTFASNASASAMKTAIDAVSGWSATLRNNTLSKWLFPLGGVSVKDNDVALCYPDDICSEYRVDFASGKVGFHTSSGFPEAFYRNTATHGIGIGGLHRTIPVDAGHRNVLVDYRAGYETVPSDIDQVAREMVQEAFQYGLHDGTLQSENLGSYAYTLADRVQLDAGQRERLAPYMEAMVA